MFDVAQCNPTLSILVDLCSRMSWRGRDHSLARNAVGRGLRHTLGFAIDSFRKVMLGCTHIRSMIQVELLGDVAYRRNLDMPSYGVWPSAGFNATVVSTMVDWCNTEAFFDVEVRHGLALGPVWKREASALCTTTC
jgi:hypothetical protein